jgi:hypothetical protein
MAANELLEAFGRRTLLEAARLLNQWKVRSSPECVTDPGFMRSDGADASRWPCGL